MAFTRFPDGQWVYGQLAEIDEQPAILTGSIEWIDGYELRGINWEYVLGETVGQFTGLHDADGKEIYEGDVILEDKDPTMLEIVFRDGIFFASIGNTHGENPYMNCALRVILDRRKTHVIGNIHDDPGLPGGGGKEPNIHIKSTYKLIFNFLCFAGKMQPFTFATQ